jgi:hypothetical protein
MANIIGTKDKANELFKIGDYLKALNLYEDALAKLSERQYDISKMGESLPQE